MAVGGIDADRMGVLLGRHDLLRGTGDALGVDRADRHQAVAVGGGEQKAAAAVGRDPATARRQRRPAELRQAAAGRVDGQAGDAVGLGAQRSVEAPRVGARRERHHPGAEFAALDLGEIAGGRVHPQHADVLAVGIGDVDDGGHGGRGCLEVRESAAASRTATETIAQQRLPSRGAWSRAVRTTAFDPGSGGPKSTPIPADAGRTRAAPLRAARRGGTAAPRRRSGRRTGSRSAGRPRSSAAAPTPPAGR